MKNMGYSWLLDLGGVNDPAYHDADALVQVLRDAVKRGDLHEITCGAHQFPQQLDGSKPGGATVFLLLKESHISAHTWPEHGRLVVDLFSCSTRDAGERVINYLIETIPHLEATIKESSRE